MADFKDSVMAVQDWAMRQHKWRLGWV